MNRKIGGHAVVLGASMAGLLAARVLADGYRRAQVGLVPLCVSRPLLEGQVRGRVRALPTLRVLDRCDVVGLAATPDGRRVTGARLHAAAEHDPGLAAAFVRVAGMVAPPRSLLRPRVVLRALRPRLHDRRA